MSDEFEDRLRTHLMGKAAEVHADPDPGALMERSVGRTGHRRPLTMGAVAVAVILTASGVLAGADLVGGRTAAKPLAAAPSTTVPGRAGAALTPGPSGESSSPGSAVQTPYTLLFTRTTTSGVTIRAYGSVSSTTGGCTAAAPCPPVGIVPPPTTCPPGAMCAQPAVLPQAQTGATEGGGAPAGGTASSGTAVGTLETPPTSSTGSGSGSTGTVPSQPAAACGQLVIELSTDRAVGSGSVPLLTSAPHAADTVELLGVGSFGTAEGAPVGWVAAWVGSGVTSVHLTSGGTSVDAMTPNSGIVVLAVPGNAELAGATVVGVDQSGATVATAPADQVPGSDTSSVCAALPTGPPDTTTTTTTTAPPSTTTTTTAPRATTTTTTTTTTALTPKITSVPSPNGRKLASATSQSTG